MGLDFAEKTAPSFRKGLDRSRIELGTPDLFTKQPESVPRAYAASVRNGQTLNVGDKFVVRLIGDQVIAMRGLSPVATFNNPSEELRSALAASHGVGSGTVQHSHDFAGTVEISVC